MYLSLSKATKTTIHWTRIEAWAGVGIPDVNGAASFGEFWLENKVESRKAIQPVSLWRPAQIAWQTRRAAFFPNVFNLVSRPRAEVVEIFSCSKLLDLVSNADTPPDLVLAAPVKWQILIEYLEAEMRRLSASAGKVGIVSRETKRPTGAQALDRGQLATDKGEASTSRR